MFWWIGQTTLMQLLTSYFMDNLWMVSSLYINKLTQNFFIKKHFLGTKTFPHYRRKLNISQDSTNKPDPPSKVQNAF